MKKFFLNLLSSFLGAWLAFLLFGTVTVLVVLSIIGKFAIGGSDFKGMDSKSVLVLNLDGAISEVETATELDYAQLMTGSIEKPQTLKMLTEALNEGASDDRVKALYIKCGEVSASPATLHALRAAVEKFHKSKKKIYAYGDGMSQGAYYVASAADSIFLNPQGNISITGIGGSVMYYKNLFDKLGVEFQIAKVGTYKSAVEPYILNEMSEPARAQLDTLYGDIWSMLKSQMAESRNLSNADIDALADNCSLFDNAKRILKSGIISALCYEREMDDKFASLLDVDKDDLAYVDCAVMAESVKPFSKSKKHIAVVYATGEINETAAGGINCYDLVPVILDLAEDDNVTGMVLRVNSPGGSVFGSEQISDALAQFQKAGKPLCVSMGDYAASGGYWISCAADWIVADPITITGSIGIFGVVPNAHKLLNNIGVNVQTVATNADGNIGIPFKPLSERQMTTLNQSIVDGYNQFIAKVAKGRKMSETKVRAIAEGRVWSGSRAKQLGLVDSLGSLNDAVKWVAAKTDTDAADVCYYPDVNSSMWDLISSVGGEALDKQIAKAAGVDVSPYFIQKIKSILYRKPQQALMPEIYIAM
jgi:protease-4